MKTKRGICLHLQGTKGCVVGWCSSASSRVHSAIESELCIGLVASAVVVLEAQIVAEFNIPQHHKKPAPRKTRLHCCLGLLIAERHGGRYTLTPLPRNCLLQCANARQGCLFANLFETRKTWHKSPPSGSV